MPHNKIAEIIEIVVTVAALFCALAMMTWSIYGIIEYSVGEASKGRAIVGGCALFLITVLWVYMRANYWHD